MGNTTHQRNERTEVLIDQAKEGSDFAWQLLFERYRKMLLIRIESRMPGFLNRSCGAEDILQETFIQAYQAIGSFEYRGEGSFREWLRVIVLRRFWNHVRKRQDADDLAPTETGALERGEGLASTSLSEDLILTEQQARVLAKLGELSDADQEVISLREFEDSSWAEIGKVLGCHRTVAAKRYGEAIARLAKLLD